MTMRKMALISRMLRKLKSSRGGATIEFIIAAPLILVAQAMAFDLGRVLLDQHGLEAGVRDATRYLARLGIDACPTTGVVYETYQALAATGVRSAIESSDITCTIIEIDDGTSGDFAHPYSSVTVIAEVTVVTPLLAGFFENLTVAAADQARMIGK